MTKAQKKTFIRDLTASVRDAALEAVKAMPEEWDGIELRWYLAYMFQCSTLGTDRSQKRRKRDYDNEVMVRNL